MRTARRANEAILPVQWSPRDTGGQSMLHRSSVLAEIPLGGATDSSTNGGPNGSGIGCARLPRGRTAARVIQSGRHRTANAFVVRQEEIA